MCRCVLTCVHACDVEARGQLPPLFKLILLSRLAGYYARDASLSIYPCWVNAEFLVLYRISVFNALSQAPKSTSLVDI